MSNSHKLLVDMVTKFVGELPHNLTSSEIGGIICSIFHEYGMPSDVRNSIFEAVERVMLEYDLRSDERAAQAADEFLAQSTAKVMLRHDLRGDERAAKAADEFLAQAAAKARK
jgi:hypothetical protein